MKFLIVDTYHPGFLASLYERQLGLERQPYAVQWRAVMDGCFGTADFYSANLRALGHDAAEVVPNSAELQRRWAREHAWHLRAAYPPLSTVGRLGRWFLSVLRTQVRSYRPDVLYVQDINWVPADLLRDVRRSGIRVVGQTAYRLRHDLDVTPFDLILTSLPNYVQRLRAAGAKTEYFQLGFEPRLLERIGQPTRRYPVSFVGGFSEEHVEGTALLEGVAGRLPVDFWGYGAETLAPGSPIRTRHHGPAWGLEMYRVLAESGVVLNRHGELSEAYANNMRLYEATGVGTCLLTDAKENLGRIFEPEREVVTYESVDDCVEKATYLLEHETERAAIARAGQARTLREHTYAHRMEEMVELVRQVV